MRRVMHEKTHPCFEIQLCDESPTTRGQDRVNANYRLLANMPANPHSIVISEKSYMLNLDGVDRHRHPYLRPLCRRHGSPIAVIAQRRSPARAKITNAPLDVQTAASPSTVRNGQQGKSPTAERVVSPSIRELTLQFIPANDIMKQNLVRGERFIGAHDRISEEITSLPCVLFFPPLAAYVEKIARYD
jgi:hypothetical protein